MSADLEKKILDEFQQVLASGNPEAELAKISSVGKKWEIVQRMRELEELKARQGSKKDVNKIDEGVRSTVIDALIDRRRCWRSLMPRKRPIFSSILRVRSALKSSHHFENWEA